MEALAARAAERLQFTVSFGDDAADYLAAQFSRKDGVESIDRLAERCFRLLSEEKLRRGVGALSGAVRVLDSSATSFDYIMQSEITDIVTRAPDGQKLVDYTMKIKLFTLDGELVGQWSDDLSLFKSR